MILLMDANEDMKNVNLAWAIRLDPKLKMKDLFRERARKYGPATWFRGNNQIDGAFATPGVDCCRARFINSWSGMGIIWM